MIVVVSKKTIRESAPKITPISLEMMVHALVNKQRHSYGLNLLKYDPALAIIARNHSMDMQQHNYFSHTNRAGEDPTGRANKRQYPCRREIGNRIYDGIAENISQSTLYDSVTYVNSIPRYHWCTANDIVRTIVKGWMHSPGHRKNILTARYEYEGIGVAISDDGKIYTTQNFF